MSKNRKPEIVLPELEPTGLATAVLHHRDAAEGITVIGTPAIRKTFDAMTLRQTVTAATSPGVSKVVLNPDAHVGYGAPIGCVMVSPSHIYPGPVGVDVKCSMSLLQLDLDAEELQGREVRRAIINAICARIPTGAGKGQRQAPKSRRLPQPLAVRAVTHGVTEQLCEELGAPQEWIARFEDAAHLGHDGTPEALERRYFKVVAKTPNLPAKLQQLGSYGGGNHFGECERVSIEKEHPAADVFGLRDGKVAFFSHCGSRGFGNILATGQFRTLKEHFKRQEIPFPGGDPQMVHAELGTKQANDYLDDMALGANFATVNHLLINLLALEAFREVFPDVQANLVYSISHNIARLEPWKGQDVWVHRKGATRAFPAGHPALVGTPFAATGHPILLPGNPRDGSVVCVAKEGAEKSCYSVNHGAGRVLGRKAAFRALDQTCVDEEFTEHDILTNCRRYPRDEAPDAYKNFDEVLRSVEEAGLAEVVARMHALFVIKDADKADD